MERKREHRYVTAVLIIAPEGIPLVQDTAKPLPHFWKLPGGRDEEGETAIQTGIREVEEEIGLRFLPDDLALALEEPRQNHRFFLFIARPRALGRLKKRGEEGENVAVFSREEMRTMVDMLPSHQQLVAPYL